MMTDRHIDMILNSLPNFMINLNLFITNECFILWYHNEAFQGRTESEVDRLKKFQLCKNSFSVHLAQAKKWLYTLIMTLVNTIVDNGSNSFSSSALKDEAGQQRELCAAFEEPVEKALMSLAMVSHNWKPHFCSSSWIGLLASLCQQKCIRFYSDIFVTNAVIIEIAQFFDSRRNCWRSQEYFELH
jgi:hypothetical protein